MERRLNIWVYIVLACLLAYLTLNFITKESKNFSSLNYNWSNTKIIKEYKIVTLDSVSDNYLSLKISKKLKVNPYNTFKLENENGVYFFRFNYSISNNKETNFRDLIWLNKNPEIIGEKFNLIELDLPILKTNGANFITISDNQLYQNEAKYFRKELRRIKNVNFSGNNKDIYGFNYSGHKELTFKSLNINYDNFPKAQYYIIMIKPKENIETAFRNLKEFVLKALSDKNMKKIILITQPVYKDTAPSIITFNNKLINFSKGKTNVLYVDTNLIGNDFPNFYRENINEISKEGYEKIAKNVSKLF